MYEQIRELTRAMLAALQAEDVDRFAQLVTERDAAMAGLSGPPDAAAAAQLREVARLDDEVAARAAHLRAQLAQALQQLGRGRDALAGYGGLSRGNASRLLDTRG